MVEIVFGIFIIVAAALGFLAGYIVRGKNEPSGQFVTKADHAQDMQDVHAAFDLVQRHIVAIQKAQEAGPMRELGEITREVGRMLGKAPLDGTPSEDRPPEQKQGHRL